LVCSGIGEVSCTSSYFRVVRLSTPRKMIKRLKSGYKV